MANRKQRRKSKEKLDDEYTQSTKNVIITLAVVLLVFGLFYLVTVLVSNSKRRLNTVIPEVTSAEIQYSEILAESTFKMYPSEYYVLFYDFDGPNAVYYDYTFTTYSKTEGNYIYKVDLGNGFNSKFVSDETNSRASKAGELKVKDATLIKISKGKNVKYVEGDLLIISAELK